jgi:hypothetical protein
MPTHRTVAISVLSVAITAVAVTGAATAVTASGAQVHTCVSKSTGAIRVAKKCSNSEKALNLGRTGPRGRKGAKGAKGARGAAGPSDVYVNRIVQTASVNVPSTGTTGNLMPIRVPAGSYVVTLTGRLRQGSESAADLGCITQYVGNATTFGDGLGVFVGGPGGAAYQSACEQDAGTFTVPTTISAHCSTTAGNAGGTAGIANADLTAVAVGAVHRFGS